MLPAAMKQHLVIPALTLVVGIGIGVVVDRNVISSSTSEEGSSDHQSSARQMGPRAATAGGRDARSNSKAGTRKHLDRNVVATIHRVHQQLEMSPMANMDFESMFEAYEAIRWMSPEDIQIALGELKESSGVNQGTMMLRFMLMGLWSKSDGKGATEYAMSLKQPTDRMMSVMSSVSGWMKHDPEGAYEWYRNNRSEMKGGLYGGMQMDGMFLASMAQNDMGRAFKELNELKGHQQTSAITMMASAVGMDDVRREEFLKELDKLGDENLKQSGMSGMITNWAMADPQGAVKYLEDMNPKPKNYDSLMQTVASSWGMMDPEGAITWQLENIKEGEEPSSKIAMSFGQWAANDPEGAIEWLDQQPKEMATDELYNQAASSAAWMDPEAATKMAMKIENKEQREMSLATIHSAVQSQGEEALKEWKEGLSPEDREAVEKFSTETSSSFEIPMIDGVDDPEFRQQMKQIEAITKQLENSENMTPEQVEALMKQLESISE